MIGFSSEAQFFRKALENVSLCRFRDLGGGLVSWRIWRPFLAALCRFLLVALLLVWCLDCVCWGARCRLLAEGSGLQLAEISTRNGRVNTAFAANGRLLHCCLYM